MINIYMFKKLTLRCQHNFLEDIFDGFEISYSYIYSSLLLLLLLLLFKNAILGRYTNLEYW